MKNFQLLCLVLFINSTLYALPWMGSLTQVTYHQKVKHDKLNIQFKEIIDDNRCPIGMQCITAGNATILLQIGSKKYSIKIGENIKYKKQQNVYDIKLIDLRPFRENGKVYDILNAFVYLQITKHPN
ncbi:MAG: hypothetical protein WCP57_08940 [Bacteroidota bacterium]